MWSRLPLQIKLINLFSVFCLDELGNELKLFTKFKYGLLKNGDFAGWPIFEHIIIAERTNQNVEIFFLVYRIYGIEVNFDRLFPFVIILFVHFSCLI